MVPRVEPFRFSVACVILDLGLRHGTLGNPLATAAAHDPPSPVSETLRLDLHSALGLHSAAGAVAAGAGQRKNWVCFGEWCVVSGNRRFYVTLPRGVEVAVS